MEKIKCEWCDNYYLVKNNDYQMGLYFHNVWECKVLENSYVVENCKRLLPLCANRENYNKYKND